METKKCSRCRRILPLDNFHSDKSKQDGRYTICKECRAGITGAPDIPNGYRQCRICDQIKPDYEYYPASEGKTRYTCKDCCDDKWAKSYRPTPGNRPGHHIQSLFGYLPTKEQVAIRRTNPSVRKKVREADAKYKTSAKGRKKRRNWVKCNRDRLRAYEHARRAREAQTQADFSDTDWSITLDAFNHKCAYCSRDDIALAQDHWIPISRNGDYTLGNIVPSCKSCNSSKRDKLPFDFCDKDKYTAITMILDELQAINRI